MIFQDQETEHKYNTETNSLLKIIAQIFCTYAFDYGHQVTMIDSDPDICVLGVEGISEDAAIHLQNKINAQFNRKDGKLTCVFQEQVGDVFSLKCGSAKDLDRLN